MRYTLITTLMLTGLMSVAQTTFELGLPPTTIFEGISDGKFVFTNKVQDFNSFDVTATIYSPADQTSKNITVFEYEGAANPNWKEDNELFREVFFSHDHFIRITSHYSKINKSNYFTVAKIGLDGKQTGNTISIPDRRYNSGQYEPKDYKYYLSPDKSKLALISHTFEKKANEVIICRIVDLNNENVISDQDVTLSSMSDRTVMDHFFINDDGVLYQLKWDFDVKKNFIGVLSGTDWKQFEIPDKLRISGSFFPKPDGSVDIVGSEIGTARNIIGFILVNITSAEIDIHNLEFDQPALAELNEKEHFFEDNKYGGHSIFNRSVILKNPVTNHYIISIEQTDIQTTIVGPVEKQKTMYGFNTLSRLMFELTEDYQFTNVQFNKFHNNETLISGAFDPKNIYQGFQYKLLPNGELKVYFNSQIQTLNRNDGGQDLKRNFFAGGYLLLEHSFDGDLHPFPTTYKVGNAIIAPEKGNSGTTFIIHNNSIFLEGNQLIYIGYAPEKIRVYTEQLSIK